MRKKIWHDRGHDMGNSVANIRLRRQSHVLLIYYANVDSVANILPIYCPNWGKYMGHKIIFGQGYYGTAVNKTEIGISSVFMCLVV